jgi:hypothetical protein
MPGLKLRPTSEAKATAKTKADPYGMTSKKNRQQQKQNTGILHYVQDDDIKRTTAKI